MNAGMMTMYKTFKCKLLGTSRNFKPSIYNFKVENTFFAQQNIQ